MKFVFTEKYPMALWSAINAFDNSVARDSYELWQMAAQSVDVFEVAVNLMNIGSLVY